MSWAWADRHYLHRGGKWKGRDIMKGAWGVVLHENFFNIGAGVKKVEVSDPPSRSKRNHFVLH
jgi:hypothetical protein